MLATAAARLNTPMKIVVLNRPDLRSIYERNLLLVRPDHHVAWRGDAVPADAEGLLQQVTGMAS